jgi:hypothetical protein
MVQRLYRIEVKMATRLEAEVDSLDAKDLAGAFRNVTTSKALQIDKLSSPLRERPSHVQQGRDLDQVVQLWRDSSDSTRRARRRDPCAVPLSAETDDPNVRAGM